MIEGRPHYDVVEVSLLDLHTQALAETGEIRRLCHPILQPDQELPMVNNAKVIPPEPRRPAPPGGTARAKRRAANRARAITKTAARKTRSRAQRHAHAQALVNRLHRTGPARWPS